jgi:hypothetical protein
MKYDNNNMTVPKMPPLGKGTECIPILLSQASKNMLFLLIPNFFTLLGTQVCVFKFQHPDLI